MDTGEIPETLLDAENSEHLKFLKDREERLSRVSREIEAILLREGMTWGEWGEVVELFSARIGQMVAIIKVKSID
jgi:hypothetical protein